jgi:hypothetical protein
MNSTCQNLLLKSIKQIQEELKKPVLFSPLTESFVDGEFAIDGEG